MKALFLINLGLSLLIALLAGRKRKIGFFWSFFFSLFFGWFLGFIVTMMSRRREFPDTPPWPYQQVLGTLWAILWGMVAVSLLFPHEGFDYATCMALCFAGGNAGLGVFLVLKSKENDTKSLENKNKFPERLDH